MQTKRKYPFANENSFEKRKKQQQNNSNPNERKSMPAKKTEKALPVMQDHRKLKPFAGIQDLVMDYSIDVEDDVEEHSNLIDDDDDNYDNEPKTTNPPLVSEPTVCGALSSLICNYESSDEELDTINQQLTQKTGLINQKTPENSLVDKVNQKNSCPDLKSILNNDDISTADNVINEDDGPEEVKFDKKVDAEINVSEQVVKTKQTSVRRNDIVGRHKKFNQNKRSKLPSTLLQKLLHKEIQQERNIVLQCIRHIVKSNYFEKI